MHLFWPGCSKSEHVYYRRSLSFYGNCEVFPHFPKNYCNGFVVLASIMWTKCAFMALNVKEGFGNITACFL